MEGSKPTQFITSMDDLLPVVIPTGIVVDNAWPGTFKRWNEVLSVTWAHFTEPYNTVYLRKSEVQALEVRRVVFEQMALNNLRKRSSEQIWTHVKEEAGEIHFVALLHEDGLGPSRLLLGDDLRRAFPNGFLFSVPERTCAIVFSKQASPAALESVRVVVSGCFQNGRERVSERIFDQGDIVG
jgi:hypothetical protein